MGCRMRAKTENGEVVCVTGFACKRGDAYAREELIAPRRMVTALVRVKGRQEPLPVKSERPLPKELVFEALAALRAIEVELPVEAGGVVLANALGTGVDFIATASC